MSRLAWKRRIGRLAGCLQRSRSRRIVLLYHSIGDSPWAVREADFQEQVRWLGRTSVCTLDALLNCDQTRGLSVALTFDDGYASLASIALDILSVSKMPATVYLNAGLMDEHAHRRSNAADGHYPDEEFLSWDDVRRLHKRGWTIGSHGVEHIDLTTAAPDRVERELRTSKAMIESRVGKVCEHFSYTWGRNNASLRSAVREAGYRYSAAAIHGPVAGGFDPFAIPRIDIHRDYTIEDFAAIVRGDWDFLGWWQRIRPRSA